jgi:hypothetical protein
MPRTVDYTVAYASERGHFDLCKILMGGDGSYYMTAPYHPHDTALAAIWTVNYAERPGIFSLGDALQIATVDDDDRRLKLAHHPDGFLQFSGEGVLSGRNDDGSAKGLGTHSWPLGLPTFGPSFGVAFSDPHANGRPSAGRPRTVTFFEEDIAHLRKGVIRLKITGFYFPVPWREFVHRVAQDHYEISIVNPSTQAVLRLRVLLGSKDSDYPGFIGIQVTPHGLDLGDGPGFLMTSATGNLRRDAEGNLLGDQLVCFYPRGLDDQPASYLSLNYPLPAPAYKANPGESDGV